ncbi:MAG TPA: hypothetical protein PKD80_07830 [Microthrixaceae bacterium]|nr:hypothetical protein [Microthrixaceae bacterium]HMT24140.1 hypothetical protein [Microthrixaceae bacterium]
MTTTAETSTPAPGNSRGRAIASVGLLVRRRPVAATAAIATLIALGHAAWILMHRRLGAFDPDEAGYLAQALRFHRNLDPLHPTTLLREVGRTGTAPLVPLLSTAFLVIGSRSPTTALLVQPLLLVVCATGIAALTRRIASPAVAVGTGLTFCTLPTVTLATQSYWLGLGATASLIAATWALAASGGGANWRVWLYGLGIAAMLLSRTMTLAFLPAAGIAGLVIARGSRRNMLRVTAAFVLGLALASPWYWAQSETVFGYLGAYGYGERAELFGPSDLIGRIGDRAWAFYGGGGVVMPTAAIGAAIAVAWGRLRKDRAGFPPTALTGPGSETRLVCALALGCLAGCAALLSSPNRGGWFETPILAWMTVLAGWVVGQAPRLMRGGIAATATAVGTLGLATAYWILPFGRPIPLPTHYEQAFAEYDGRFGSNHRDQLAAVAAEWAGANRQVVDDLAAIDPKAVVSVSGNMELSNTNAMLLAAELRGLDLDLRVPDTESPTQRRAALEPVMTDRWGSPREHLIVLIRHDHRAFTPDAMADRFQREMAHDWRTVRTIALPGGAKVEIYRHSPAGASAG